MVTQMAKSGENHNCSASRCGRIEENHGGVSVTALQGSRTMLTQMGEDERATVLKLFRACRSRRGDKGRNDRKFLEALHYFTLHNITWRALPAEFGNWNSVWKRFWRLSQAACSRRSSTRWP